MLKSPIEHKVKAAIEEHAKSDPVTNDELCAIITDVIYETLRSSDFIDHVNKELGRKVHSRL